MKRVVYFDLDGTLVDSLPDITDSVNFVLNSYGMIKLDEATVRGMVGNGTRDLIQAALAERSDLTDQALALFMEHYGENYMNRAKVYPFVIDTLAKIKARKVVVTNKPESITGKLLIKSGIIKVVDRYISPETYNTKKPDPTGIFSDLKENGFNLSDAVLVGDSIVDIKTGQNADIKTIAVSYGYSDKKEYSMASIVIDSIDKLLQYI